MFDGRGSIAFIIHSPIFATAQTIIKAGKAMAVAAIKGAAKMKTTCQIAGGKCNPSSGIMTGGPGGACIGIDPVWLPNHSNIPPAVQHYKV